jgi:hypothetical protein
VREADRGVAATVAIVWSEGDGCVALTIEGVPQAAFDLAGRRATCLTGSAAALPHFPPPYEWDESVVAAFYD